jgi:hypothetical protein
MAGLYDQHWGSFGSGPAHECVCNLVHLDKLSCLAQNCARVPTHLTQYYELNPPLLLFPHVHTFN